MTGLSAIIGSLIMYIAAVNYLKDKSYIDDQKVPPHGILGQLLKTKPIKDLCHAKKILLISKGPCNLFSMLIKSTDDRFRVPNG